MTDITTLRAKLIDAQQRFEDMDDDAGVLLTECCAEMLTLLESPAAPQVAGSGDSARYPVEILRNIRDWMDGPAFEYAVCPLPVSLATEVRTCVALMEAPTPAAPCANAELKERLNALAVEIDERHDMGTMDGVTRDGLIVMIDELKGCAARALSLPAAPSEGPRPWPVGGDWAFPKEFCEQLGERAEHNLGEPISSYVTEAVLLAYEHATGTRLPPVVAGEKA